MLIGEYPDVKAEHSTILIPSDPNLRDVWHGPKSGSNHPYILVKCGECNKVTLYYYEASHWWIFLQSRWRKHVAFDFVLGHIRSVAFGKNEAQRLYYPTLAFDLAEKQPDLSRAMLRDQTLFELVNIASTTYSSMLSRMVDSYVVGKQRFREHFMAMLSSGTYTGYNNDLIIHDLKRQYDENLRLKQIAELVLCAANQFYKGRDRGKQSSDDKAMRLELARTAKGLGADVPPELLVDASVDASQKKTESAPAPTES